MKFKKKLGTWIFIFFISINSMYAGLKLPGFIKSNMVLQREAPVAIWGWAPANTVVNVKFGKQTKQAIAEKNGTWQVKLDAIPANTKPQDLIISAPKERAVTLKNILVGDVWLCSGQSNMAFQISRLVDKKMAAGHPLKKEIASADFPLIRICNLRARKFGQKPAADIYGSWSSVTSGNISKISGTAYFFGKELFNNLRIPIGLISCAWSSSPIEAWTSYSLIENEPREKPLLESWEKKLKAWDVDKGKSVHQVKLKKFRAWLARVRKRRPNYTRREPRYTGRPNLVNPMYPGNLYNSMIWPLTKFTIRGCIWYQGESNVKRAWAYQKTFINMINDWRKQWNSPQLPFLYVQLANFGRTRDVIEWAELREAQTMARALPHTGMVVAIDIGEHDNIHPWNKIELGKRLAKLAMAKAYGKKDIKSSGPVYKQQAIKDNKIVLNFSHAGQGLCAGIMNNEMQKIKFNNDGKLDGFTIAGKDKKFYKAQAHIIGDSIVVSSEKVPEPVAVRYYWGADIRNDPSLLYNRNGLPASPFRTDSWDLKTKNK